MAPRRKCPVCGSRQWHKEPTSGLIACSEGHVLQNYRNETTDGDAINVTTRKRTLKSVRQKKGRQSKANPRLLHGSRGRNLYFKCLQLILRHQISALMQIWSLPKEFEIVCRELWTLHLCMLAKALMSPDDIKHNSIASVPAAVEDIPEAERIAEDYSKEVGGWATLTDNRDTTEKENSDGRDSDSEFDELEDEGEPDELMDDILRENSVISSSEDDSDSQSQAQDLPSGVKYKRKRKSIEEKPLCTVAILLLACYALRVPVMGLEFIALIEQYRLPFLEPLKYIPTGMASQLTKYRIKSLTPLYPPSGLTLHTLLSRLSRKLNDSYSVVIPELNAAPILWRITEYMAGTPTLYGLTKRLARILSIPLTLHQPLASSAESFLSQDPSNSKYDNVSPEISLMATLIIVLKMVYGLDGKVRTPHDSSDPACALSQVEAYLSTIFQLEEEGAKRDENVFSPNNKSSVEAFDDGQVDRYLSFCEGFLLPQTNQSTKQVLDSYFPLGDKDNAVKSAPRQQYPSARPAALPDEDNDNPEQLTRPGEQYPIFSAKDVLGTIPHDLSTVISRGAKWLRVPDEYLLGVLEKYERRLERWGKRTKKESRSEM